MIIDIIVIYYFFIGIVILSIFIYFHHVYDIDNDDDNKYNDIDKHFLFQFQKNLKNLKFNNDDSDDDINKNTLADQLFPLIHNKIDSINKNTKNARRLYNRDIYDGKTGNLILSSKGEWRIYPKAQEIPHSCGFGKLHFYTSKNNITWTCICSAPQYFGGLYCDEPQKKLLVENKCAKVGYINDLDNTDISTFNPFLQGVCVQCSTRDATPDLSSPVPKCHNINKIKNDDDDDDDDDKKDKDICFSDPVNPNLNSIFNKYIDGYGCSCDYYNGFVEINIGGYNNNNNNNNSNACLKIGKRSRKIKDYYHKTHMAYYTLKNDLKPIQVHEYQELEQPYQSLFFGKKNNNKLLLVDQPARKTVHKQDWLNRHIKAKSTQKIRRINYPHSDWPVVHKYHFVNKYERRNETYPISAYKMAIGRGFETKHWYETTNQRYLSNSVWGHPVMYGSSSISSINIDNYKGNKWEGLCTLNPLGPKYSQYYGLTMLYKPGSVVKLDTRGFHSEKHYNRNVVTLPPNYRNEMMNPNDYTYISLRYHSYTVTN